MTSKPGTNTLEIGEAAGWRSDVVETVGERASADEGANLVRLAQRGDMDAFDTLARARIDRAYRLAVAILRSETDAQDAVQDAFVSAWRHLPGLRDAAHFDAWLDRIIVNACRMLLRRRHVVRVREISVEDPAELSSLAAHGVREPGPAESIADSDLIGRAMERLDANKRAILVLHHVEDRPIDEIAAVLGIPAGTVKWRLHEARGALQRALEEELR